MKTFAFVALSVIASAAMAAGEVGPASSITITGSSTQLTSISDALVKNKAEGPNAEALQNLASNAGNVTISGSSNQTAIINSLATVSNEARKSAIAQQNLASNVGNVTINAGGKSKQMVTVDDAAVGNFAGADAIAQQSLSSNVGNVTVGTSSQTTTVEKMAYVLNSAVGMYSKAVQNISSNNSCSTFTCANTVR